MILKRFFSGQKKNNENLSDELSLEKKNNTENSTWFSRLKSKLKSSSFFIKGVFKLFEKSEIDYFALEEMLLDFDIGYEIVSDLIEKIKTKDKWGGGLNPESAKDFIKKFMLEILKPYEKKFSVKQFISDYNMAVLIFCGINGAGKTTTISKIASLYKDPEKNFDNLKLKPLFVACDVFRAAAFEQLDFWAKKLDLDIFFGNENQSKNNNLTESDNDESCEQRLKKIDPASIAFSSIEYAKKNDYNLIMIDTSGRLHNNTNLMAELGKLNRVLKKHNENFANEVILVLDGTNGQNLLDQFEMFNKTVKITGIILTKLDGVSKGGILLSIVHKFKIPVYFIGIGESEDDINYFNSEEFIDSLFD